MSNIEGDSVYAHKFAIMQKQINEKDAKIKELQDMLKEKDKLYHKALGDLVKTDRENIQLKKEIDLMAEYMEENMDEYQLDEIYSKQYNRNGMERNWTRGKEKEIKDIKQYFEKLAKENMEI